MRFKTWFEFNDEEEIEVEIRGEYWIDNHGDTHYCDSDIGDIGHEGVIIDMVAHEIANEVGFESDDQIDTEKLLQFIADEDLSIPPEKLALLAGRVDGRIYGMKVYGWKAVRGNAVETWSGTPRDFKCIAEGLLNIIYEEGLVEDENLVDQVVFSVWVHSKAVSTDYTIGQLKNGGMDPISAAPVQPTQPFKIGMNQYNFGANNISKNQIADQEKSGMNQYYQQKNFPFADWNLRHHG